MQCRPARAFSELCAAFRLVHDNYVAAGCMAFHPSGMHYTALQLLPVSTTWIAICDQEIVGTGTIVTDSVAGLPSSAVFADHFRALRCQSRTIAEGTLLACRSRPEADAVSIICTILRHGMHSSHVDDFCIVADPEHLSFWRDFLGFENLTNERLHGHAVGHPGVLMRLDLRGITRGARQPTKGYQKLLSQPRGNEDGEGESFRLSPDQIANLIELRPHILAKATSSQRELLRDYVDVTQKPSMIFSSRFPQVA